MKSPAVCGLFAAAVGIQTFHMLEHVVQVLQVFLFGVPRAAAHGLLGQLDFEWVHFVYNAALIAVMGIIVAKCAHARGTRTGFRVFVAGTAIQGYHMIEHLVKIQQHIATGMHGTPGILGTWLDPVLFHFSINLIVYLAIIYAFFRQPEHER